MVDVEDLSVPKSALDGARYVMERARAVRIDHASLAKLARVVEARLRDGIDDIETAFGTTGLLERDVNLVFFETAVNFCFWGDPGKDKWAVERDGEVLGGWYSLAACFERAIAEGVPVYDAQYMADLDLDQARRLFRGVHDGIEIPLLERRVRNLNEAGAYLLGNYEGQCMKLLQSVDFSAPRLAEKVARELESYQDGAVYAGRWVWMLKRAQILAGDLSQLSARYPDFHIRDCDQLTAFADYRIPQVFRHFGVFVYKPELAQRIDNYEYLEAGSGEEVEIRAATIRACEELKALLPARTTAEIDVGVWLVSQDLRSDPTLAPHHRTLGYFY